MIKPYVFSSQETNSWLGSVGSAISGFASGVGSVLTGISEGIGNLIDGAISFAKDVGKGIIDKVGSGIDSFLKDPLGTTFGVIKGVGETIINTASGIATWVMQNPWQALAIVGLAAFALTGIGAIVGAGWAASAGSFLFNAELLATGGLLGYKTVTGTLTTEDLVLGGLSLGPLAVAKVFQITGVTAKLAPHLTNAISRVGNAIGQSRIAQKISSGFSKITKAAGKAANKVEAVFEERMLASWIKGTKPHLDPGLANKLDELLASHQAGTHGALQEIRNLKYQLSKSGRSLNAQNVNRVLEYKDKFGNIQKIEFDALPTEGNVKIISEAKSVDPSKFKDQFDMKRWLDEKIDTRVAKINEAKNSGASELQGTIKIEFSIPKAATDDIDFYQLLAQKMIDLEKQYGIEIKLVTL